MSITLIGVIFFIFSFSSVTNYSNGLNSPYSQVNDSSAWMRLENLPFGIKNHITKSWISNGTEYLVIAGGRIHDTLTKCVMLIRLYPRTYYYLLDYMDRHFDEKPLRQLFN